MLHANLVFSQFLSNWTNWTNKNYKQFRDLTRNWTQIACLAVRDSNQYTRVFSVLVSRLNATCELITACPFGYGIPVCALPLRLARTEHPVIGWYLGACSAGTVPMYLEGETHCQPCGPNTNTGGRPGTSARDCGESKQTAGVKCRLDPYM